MKILSFAGSNSSKSINRKLSAYASSLFENADVELLDINDYEMPLFSQDRENEIGKHPLAQAFLDKIASADAIVLSLAENNGNYSAAFKNLFDWCSRIQKEVFQNKPMLLLATSPGQRGGKSVLEIAESNLPRYGGNIKAVFSLPSFYENFDTDAIRVTNQELDANLRDIVSGFAI
ncbi:NADPH-dependent FMN reductase [Flavobacterium pallidum]|uniref:NADPH-dependent FMN reductase n=1 Tax=Flavobacterium pallidum TaxID=2172098 RepID=A0A2S1SJP8_9FLAO|nr:NAD(P)H-dependent oxidoreductase [Flavobacterium pallidum]AWI26596.1 NADPH-dependent FMN reductase [Flavobacterium pallidum]